MGFHHEPTDEQVAKLTARLSDMGLEHSWSCPFAMGTIALYKDATEWGVMVYWDAICTEGRIFRPVIPTTAPVESQVAEVGRLLAIDRGEAK
jgi:hypothetical protein